MILELRFKRHQAEANQLGCIPKESLDVRQYQNARWFAVAS
jgi:hypothetical protein